MANRWGNSGNSDRSYIFGLQNHCRWWCSHEIKRCLLLGRKAMINLDSILKSSPISLSLLLIRKWLFIKTAYGLFTTITHLGKKEGNALTNRNSNQLVLRKYPNNFSLSLEQTWSFCLENILSQTLSVLSYWRTYSLLTKNFNYPLLHEAFPDTLSPS